MAKKIEPLYLHCQKQLEKKLHFSALKVFAYYNCPFQIIDLCGGLIYHNRPNSEIKLDNTHFLSKIPEKLFPLITYQNILEDEFFYLQIGFNIIIYDEILNLKDKKPVDLEGYSTLSESSEDLSYKRIRHQNDKNTLESNLYLNHVHPNKNESNYTFDYTVSYLEENEKDFTAQVSEDKNIYDKSKDLLKRIQSINERFYFSGCVDDLKMQLKKADDKYIVLFYTPEDFFK
ncbi:hypothetical protein M153_3200032681 [Pseudoloma neurophilia]|uniref:Uncharacterized protein n=1 Tax=Pseudoloma neurophilia TaxID=146866 RepID=A0A0R0M675_9MICR|nr:hypothetical protein M153_3200032681 [Pseudoloma neurophilia]